MKTRNLNQPGERSHGIVRGHIGTARAGSTGIDFINADGTEVDNVTTATLQGLVASEFTDGTVVLSTTGITIVGTVTPDGTPFTVSSGTDHRAFPGAAWIDDPTATTHVIGDRFLLVYRHGTDHFTGGKIVGRICTITDDDPWTYTVAAEFDIEDVANDLRCDDAVSVLDIDGLGDYRAVVAAREYNGSVNLSPHVLVCDDSAATMTSGSTWTRHNIALSGHTQDFVVDRVHRLVNGEYLVAFGYISGTTHVNGSAKVSDVTDWSAPSFANMNSSTSARDEIDIEELASGTLFAHLRNDTTDVHEHSESTDHGDTWSTPTTIFAAATGTGTGLGFPMFRILTSGIGITVYRSQEGGAQDTAYRQTALGSTDASWGDETILDDTSFQSAYATILQLDDNHALLIYAVEDATFTDADIYSQVFTDSSVFGSASLVAVSSGDTTPGYLEDKLAAGSGITTTKLGTGGDESLEIAATFGGGASAVTVADAGGFFDGTDVEAVLQEVGADAATESAIVAALPNHLHIAQEERISDGATTSWVLDNDFQEGSVMARNQTTGHLLSVTETLPNIAAVSAAGTALDVIAFAYAAPIV